MGFYIIFGYKCWQYTLFRKSKFLFEKMDVAQRFKILDFNNLCVLMDKDSNFI